MYDHWEFYGFAGLSVSLVLWLLIRAVLLWRDRRTHRRQGFYGYPFLTQIKRPNVRRGW